MGNLVHWISSCLLNQSFLLPLLEKGEKENSPTGKYLPKTSATATASLSKRTPEFGDVRNKVLSSTADETTAYHAD